LPQNSAPDGAVGLISHDLPAEALNRRFIPEHRSPSKQRFAAWPSACANDRLYEQKKYEHILHMLHNETIGRALVIVCGKSCFIEKLAPRVKSLVAIDTSSRTLEQIHACSASHANIQFRCLDLIDEEIPGNMDLIVCLEVLHFLEDVEMLHRISTKLVRALTLGGRLITAHSFLLTDDADQSGFDWNYAFGAKVIEQVLSATRGLQREKSVVSDLYRIDLYTKDAANLPRPLPKICNVGLDLPLESEIQREIVWGGVVNRRAQVIKTEATENIPILMYHRVSSDGAAELGRYRVDPTDFEQQLRFLRQHGYHTISVDNLLGAARSGHSFAGRPIMLTFDDGYKDFYDTAWPILKRYDFSAHVFVVTGRVAGCADWDRTYGEPAALMGWGEIEALSGCGVTFGSHLATHRAADCLSTAELLNEGRSSRCVLEARLRENVRSVAFPFGICNSRIANTLRLCGYEIGFSTSHEIASIRMDPMILPRVEIMGSDTLSDFAGKIGRLASNRRAGR
jgi:peptidoglycan/xylan/chitin deacetylase (PgdA/CDA1 family)